MSVQDLQDSLEKVAEQADGFAGMLSKFMQQNSEDLEEVEKALVGTKTTTSSDVKSALDEAARAIDDAKKAMEDAAMAARNYANSI